MDKLLMPIVNIIHLPETDEQGRPMPHRIARGENIRDQFANIRTQIWPGVLDWRGGFFGISKAHKNIIRWAKEYNLPEVWIAEDDCCFTAVGAWEYFVWNKPDDFDLYLSSIYSGAIDENNITRDFCGLTLYVCHSRFYDKFLAVNGATNLDQVLGPEGVCKVCIPFTTYQMDGFSDNKRTYSELTPWMDGRPIFGK